MADIKSLLARLLSGELDGKVGNALHTDGGSEVWTEIVNGIPKRFKEGPGGKFFDGKENVSFSGKRTILESWDTDEQKIGFLQKFGWLMDDSEAKEYSALFKPKK